MDQADGKHSSTKHSSGNGSCIRIGVPESDTGDSGEESEPTYRHYDNFETDMSLTQDEDEPLESNTPIIKAISPVLPVPRDPPLPRDNFPVNNLNRGLSSDSDSCGDSDMFVGRNGQVTDDTTTSTSESEETQIWVPVGRRPSSKQGTVSPPPSATSSNGSDTQSRPQSIVTKPISSSGYATGSLSLVTSPPVIEERYNLEEGRRQSLQNLQTNLQSSMQKKMTPKHVSVGVLRHDATGTITLDIQNVPSLDTGLANEDDRMIPNEDVGYPDTPGTTASILRNRQSNVQTQAASSDEPMSFQEGLCLVLSGLYMLFIIVAGAVVPIAEIFTDEPQPSLFEGFYIYLHVMSIAFLVYAYAYLLRMNNFSLTRRGRTVVSSVPLNNRNRKYSGDDASNRQQTGSFYLRLGAVCFGIGSMIKSGLHFGEFFELDASPLCHHVLHGIRPILHLCFTFVQLYFVFLNSKMYIHRYKLLARFGLMHMVATNICVWLENVVKETLRELNKGPVSDVTSVNTSRSGSNGKQILENSSKGPQQVTSLYETMHCYGSSLMGEVVQTSSPYLYPCSIEYSLICGSILLVMWYNLGSGDRKGSSKSDDDVSVSERAGVDCRNSSRGLFLGIIVLVATVIILITFFVLVRTDEFRETAVKLEHLSEMSIFTIVGVAVIFAFQRMYPLRTVASSSGLRLEEGLLILSLFGVYVLCIASIISGGLDSDGETGLLIVLSNCLQMIQATLQSVFLFNAMKKSAITKTHATEKPGREFVTFLLICNVALWGMNIFEVQRSDANMVQARFYGNIAWNIITHISVPLAIFFRFHSTVCLANIWKHAWKPMTSS